MTQEKHVGEISNTLEQLKELLVVKSKEYVKSSDPLHNFSVGATITGQCPARVLDGFLLKHYVSYRDMLTDIEAGRVVPEAKIHEKFNDILVYFLLQKNIFLSALDMPDVEENVDVVEPKKEIRVYLVALEGKIENPAILVDSDFILQAEMEGKVFSLQEFQYTANNSSINLEDYILRII
jgi:hypothetical protein